MPKGIARDWPPIDELLSIVEQEGTIVGAARRLDITDKTLRSKLDREGVLDQAQGLLHKKATADKGPASDDVSTEEILRQRMEELEKALRKQRQASVSEERILRAVEDVLGRMSPPARPPALARPKRKGDEAHHRALLVLSDFHGGEQVDPEVVNQLNRYDWETMELRVEETLGAVLSHAKSCPPLTGLDVAFVGDMCSGANHDEITITNEYPLAEQGVKIGLLQGQIIERLAPHFADVRVVQVEGNHPRLTRKPAAKEPHNNMDWVAGVLARQYVSTIPNVSSYVIGRGSALHTIAGRTIYVFHGDGIRSSMPGVPWGGVMRRVNQIQATHTQRIDHFVLGHFHQANVVQGGRIVMNGSLKGVDEWTLKNFGGGDAPTQLLLVFDEKRRRLTDTKFITPTAGLLSD